MSKVIVIDQCGDCIYYGGAVQYFCCTKECRPCDPDIIPDWCTLPDLPERKEEMDYLATGYNKCLDDILEEAQE